MTIRDFLTDWHTGREVLLKRSTYEAEGIYITRHLIPYFEEVCPVLEELRPIMVQNYTRFKLKGGRMDEQSGGLSLVSVRKHLAILRQALDEAVMLEYLEHNPAASVRLPKRLKGTVAPRTVFLTAEEAQRLLDGIAEHPVCPAVALALLYGLRRSEVLGLRWDAIDFEAGTITICHTVVKNLTVQESDTTKTENSRRTFQMLPEVRTMLEQLRERAPKGSQYLFCHEDGSVWRPDCLTRTFQRQLQRVGLPQMRFHDLRHSTASILFDRGWALEDVKNWLGHADIETTMNVYAHATEEMQRAAAKKIDEAIGKALGGDKPRAEPSSDVGATDRPSRENAPEAKFEAYKGKKRKPGKGYVKQLSPNCWQGRYTPTIDGKRVPMNIYAPTVEECEIKLAELIKEINEQRKGKTA